MPLSFVGFVADPRWSFGADRGAFRDYEIRSAWIMLIGSLLPPVLACLLAGVVVTGRGTGRRWRALGAILIVSAVALASWKLSADIHTLLDTISTTWRPGL